MRKKVRYRRLCWLSNIFYNLVGGVLDGNVLNVRGKDRREFVMTSLGMRNLIFEALAEKDPEKTPWKKTYPELKSLSPSLDNVAKAIYATYLRLTRNELVHPSRLKIDRVQCLSLMTSYIKYCEIQHKYLDFYIANS